MKNILNPEKPAKKNFNNLKNPYKHDKTKHIPWCSHFPIDSGTLKTLNTHSEPEIINNDNATFIFRNSCDGKK